MLNFLFQGLFDLLTGVVEGVLDMIIGAFNVDISGFVGVFPIMNVFLSIFNSVGWSLLILLMVVAIMKSIMNPNSQQAEHPLSILGRTVIAGGFLAFSGNLMDLFLLWGNSIFEVFSDVDPGAGAGLTFGRGVIDLISTGVAAIGGVVTGGVSVIIQLVLLAVMFFEIAKFLLEALTRYATLCFGTFLAPLVAPAFVSKATVGIFSSYLSFIFGQTVLLWMSTIFMKIIVNGLYSIGNPGTGSFFFKYFLLLAVIKLAQQADNILVKLGFKTVRQSGLGVAGGMVAAAGMIAHSSIGKNMGSMFKNSPAGKVSQKGKEAALSLRSPTSGAGGCPGEMIPKYNPPGGKSKETPEGAGRRSARKTPNEEARAALQVRQAGAAQARSESDEKRSEEFPEQNEGGSVKETDVQAARENIGVENMTPAEVAQAYTAQEVPAALKDDPMLTALKDDVQAARENIGVENMTPAEVAQAYAAQEVPAALKDDPMLMPQAEEKKGKARRVQADDLQPGSKAALETGIRQYSSLVSSGEMTCRNVSNSHTGFTLSEDGHWTYTNPEVQGAPVVHGNIDPHEMLPAAVLSERISASSEVMERFSSFANDPAVSPALQDCYRGLATAEQANVQRMEAIQQGNFDAAKAFQSRTEAGVGAAAKAYQQCGPTERAALLKYGMTGGGRQCVYQSGADPTFAASAPLRSGRKTGGKVQPQPDPKKL